MCITMTRSQWIILLLIIFILAVLGFAIVAGRNKTKDVVSTNIASDATTTREMFDITLTIEGVAPTTTHTILEGVTALSLVQTVSQVRGFEFKTKKYAGMGELVEKMGALENGREGKFWHYYINGALAPVGADAYIIKKGDAIEWRFHEPDTSM